MSNFPITRLRRLRRNAALRKLFEETVLDAADLVFPLFVVEGHRQKQTIDSMPGIYRYSVDLLPAEAERIAGLGIGAVILFGLPSRKDPLGSEAYNPQGAVQQAVKALKASVPQLVVINDVCLCEYTDHGHCGVLSGSEVDNDKTLEILSRTALSYAEAGSDMVAPSDMMDGRVQAIRRTLDTQGFSSLPIMAYSAKFASAFYDSFREAADCAPRFGDRRAYQMPPPNWREALREVEQDIAEGADIVMVKPALPYLDIISKVRQNFNHPLAAYNVSGEYAMLKAAVQRGWLDEKRAVMETLTAIKRAGADIIISYHAAEAAAWLKENV